MNINTGDHHDNTIREQAETFPGIVGCTYPPTPAEQVEPGRVLPPASSLLPCRGLLAEETGQAGPVLHPRPWRRFPSETSCKPVAIRRPGFTSSLPTESASRSGRCAMKSWYKKRAFLLICCNCKILCYFCRMVSDVRTLPDDQATLESFSGPTRRAQSRGGGLLSVYFENDLARSNLAAILGQHGIANARSL